MLRRSRPPLDSRELMCSTGAGNFAEPEAVAAFGSLFGNPAVTMPIPILLSSTRPSRRGAYVRKRTAKVKDR